MVKNLTKKQLESIQIDEALAFLDYGEETERVLAPTRGGGEFSAVATIRDIEFDGRHGKTAGAQVIEDQTATVKVTTLCMSQENLALAIPGCVVSEAEGKVIENPECGIIPESAYLKNITLFAKCLGGTYKKITIFTPMHESGLNTKAVQKAEGELAFEFSAHYTLDDLEGKGKLWRVEDISEYPTVKTVAAPASTKIKVAGAGVGDNDAEQDDHPESEPEKN